jgi:methylated-DNA-[protein]-cysteine S-methyltransferase
MSWRVSDELIWRSETRRPGAAGAASLPLVPRMLFTTLDSPVGGLLLLGDAEALTGLFFPEHARRPGGEALGEHRPGAFAAAAEQLEAYFAGRLAAFDLPLAPAGTPFQQDVWRALRTVPYGETTTYGELARRAGHPGAARAVGAATARNPISIVTPCHRAVGASGALTGYAGGLERKRALLALERDGPTRTSVA